MKQLPILLLLLLGAVYAQDNAQAKKPATLREILLAELRSTHTTAEWFVPANTAVKGLTAEQASWKRWQRQPLGRPACVSPGVLEPAEPGAA